MNTDKLANHLESLIGDTKISYKKISQLLSLEDDPHLTNLIENGEFIEPNEKAYLCDHPFGMCHQAVVHELKINREDGDKLYTGMAMSLGEWFRHSWIINKEGSVVEPCKTLCEAYFGQQLVGKQEKSFTQ